MNYKSKEFNVEIGQAIVPIEINDDFKKMLEDEGISDDISFLFTKAMAVPDVHRYNVDIIESKSGQITVQLDKNNAEGIECIEGSKYNDLNPENIQNSIVLVLESPHIDEFTGIKTSAKTIAPAQGSTGRNIEIHLNKHIEYAYNEGLLPSGKYAIVIVESISWNTSLSVLTGRRDINVDLRNEVLRKVWEIPEVQENFKDRVAQSKPSLIINACTGKSKEFEKNKNSGNETLHYLVLRFLERNFKVPIISAYHPVSPHFFETTNNKSIPTRMVKLG